MSRLHKHINIQHYSYRNQQIQLYFRTLSNMSTSTSGSSIVSEPYDLQDFMNDEFGTETTASHDTINANVSTHIIEDLDEIMSPTRTYTPSVMSDNKTQRSSNEKSRKWTSASSNEQADILREFLNHKQPTPIEFLPSKRPEMRDNLQQFFEAIASTMRTFSPVSIAKIKLKISQIVGEEEIVCAEKNAAAEEFYLYSESSRNRKHSRLNH